MPAAVVAVALGAGLAVSLGQPASAINGGQAARVTNGQVQFFVGGRFHCTGSLISRQWVLLADHCITDYGATTVNTTVTVGTLARGDGSGEQHSVNQIADDPAHDTALLQLTNTTSRTDQVMPYGVGELPEGTQVSVSGWGQTQQGLPPSDELRTATLTRAPGDGLRPGEMRLNEGSGLAMSGDSGAGVFSNGAICGVVSRSTPFDSYTTAFSTDATAAWIQSVSGVAPSPSARCDGRSRRTGLRMMVFGDSISWGFASSTGNGFRDTLQNLLQQGGRTVDMVGSQRSGSMPDNENEGHPGYRIDQLYSVADTEVANYKPNVITVHVGTNDMNQDYDVAGAPDRLRTLLDDIYGADPDVTVVLSTIIRSNDPAVNARVQQFDAAIPGVADDYERNGKHLELVDMSSIGADDMSDDLHPNDAGYEAMGEIFASGVEHSAARGWIAQRPGDGSGGINPDPGPGKWQDQGEIASGVGADPNDTYTHFADLDGDGRADYLDVNPIGAVTAWRNEGSLGSGGTGPEHWGWYSLGTIATGIGDPGQDIQFADLNGDGRADYLGVRSNGAVDMYENGGYVDGKWDWINEGTVATGIGAPGSEIQFADLNGDGRADYLAVDPKTGATDMYLNGGVVNGKWDWIDYGQIAGGVRDNGDSVTQYADLNSDGYADYLYVSKDNGTVSAYSNRGGRPGNWGWVKQGQVQPGAGVPSPDNRVLEADVDGDGRADYLSVDRQGAVHAWLDEGRDTTPVAGWLPRGKIAGGIGIKGANVAFADLNGDGLTDYYGIAEDGSVHAYLNGGSKPGGWDWIDEGTIFGAFDGIWSKTVVRLGDLNGDGRADYLRIDRQTGEATAWLNEGGTPGHWNWTPVGPVSDSPTGKVGQFDPNGTIGFADLTGDGKDDYRYTDGAGATYLNPNTWPTFDQAHQRVATGVGASGRNVRFADVDGDGRDDYVTVGSDGSLGLWRNGGNNGAVYDWIDLGQVAGGVAPADQVRLADLDGDGRADYLAVADDGSVTAYLNNGTDRN